MRKYASIYLFLRPFCDIVKVPERLYFIAFLSFLYD